MNQGGVGKEIGVCRIPAALVPEVGTCAVNEVGDCRKKKDGPMIKAVEYCTGELDSSPLPQCSCRMLDKSLINKLFTGGHCVPIFWVANLSP